MRKRTSLTQVFSAAIALGSNLGDCLALLGAARLGLDALAQPGSLRCSPLFRTAA
ncbi:MAG: hypothetical protein RLZZ89_1033, partial [Cyanobacteriota bacterium]